MKIKDFEKCIDIMELELKHISVHSSTGSEVMRAIAIKRDDEFVRIYFWNHIGNCMMEIFNTSDEDMIEKLLEVLWSFPVLLEEFSRVKRYDMPELERKYFAK